MNLNLHYLLLLIFIALSAICHSIDQIKVNRYTLTRLPYWVWSGKNWFGLSWPDTFDGFHVFKELGQWFMFLTGIVYSFVVFHISPLWLVVLWIYKGQVFNLFYHVIFMRKNHRDWRIF